MRTLLATALIACAAALPGYADEPDYVNDKAVNQSIQAKGAALVEAEKTTANAELQQQLAERKRYDAAPPEPATLTEDGQDLYESVADGVIVIARLYLCGKCDKLHANNASGFVISADGLAVTNYHVMENDDEKTHTFVAVTRDGKVVPVVEVLAGNKNDDTALIRLGGEGFTPVPIARTAQIGERVHCVSHPAGRFYQYSSGEVSRFFLKPQRNNARRVTVTSDYAGGSSGGPIFNDSGQVVAVVSEAVVVRDHKIVFYDSVPYASILDLFAQAKADADENAGEVEVRDQQADKD